MGSNPATEKKGTRATAWVDLTGPVLSESEHGPYDPTDTRAHLVGVAVVTRLQHHEASLLTRAALGHQALAGLEMVELWKERLLVNPGIRERPMLDSGLWGATGKC